MNYFLTGLLGSAVLLSATTNLQAEEQNAVIVTATRTAQTVDESLASVTVISEADIQRSQASNLQDLLQAYAGVDMRNSGGLGKSTSIFLRGTNSNHVLVMVDGVKIGSATLGGASFQDIPVAQIERIEIVRGPRSSLYGAEAIGGVIQIFTKKGTDKTIRSASIGYGRYNTSEVSAGISGRSNATRFNARLSHQATDGFSAIKTDTLDDDGYENTSAALTLSHQLKPGSDISFNLLRAQGTSQFDNIFDPTRLYESEYVQQTAGVKMSHSVTKSWRTMYQISQSLDESEEFADGSPTNSIFNTTRNQSFWQNDITIGTANIFSFGIDHQNDQVGGTTPYNEKSRDNTGIYLQHQWKNNNSDIIVGLRQDDNEAFGTHNTGNLAWGYQINNKYRISGSYGSGFSAPTFNQLYYPGYGVATLKPEESASYELGLHSRYEWGQWDIHVYQTTIDNLINLTPANVDKAKIDGIEFRLGGELMGLQHQLDVSFTNPRDEQTNKILQRRSRQSLRYAVDQTEGKFNYGLTFIGQGEQFNDASNAERVSGYGLVNIRTSYNFNKEWTLRAKVDNVFDKDYESIETYNTPGASAFVSIHYQGL